MMDEPRHLYVTDLDGTLLNAEGEISLFGAEAIKSFIDSGGLFSFATARSLISVQGYIERLNLRLPVVLYNGAFVYDPVRAEYLTQNYLPSGVTSKLLAVLSKANLNPLIHTETPLGQFRVDFKNVSNEGERVYLNDRLSRNDPRLRVTDTFVEVGDEQVIAVVAIGSKDTIAACIPFVQSLVGVQYYFTEDVYSPGYFWLEVVNHQATKAYGVDFVKHYIGAEKLTCFGNDLNDIPMFKLADYAYAVANAHVDVKLAASGLIHSSKEDGVPRFLLNLKGPQDEQLIRY